MCGMASPRADNFDAVTSGSSNDNVVGDHTTNWMISSGGLDTFTGGDGEIGLASERRAALWFYGVVQLGSLTTK